MDVDSDFKTLLVIDNGSVLSDGFQKYFAGRNIEVLSARSPKEALAICSQTKVSVVVLDLKFSDVEGPAFCPSIRIHNPETRIIFIVPFYDFNEAVRALRLGAYDCIARPFEWAELIIIVEKALQAKDTKTEQQLCTIPDSDGNDNTVIGALGGNLEVVDLAAATDAPVLITGETGTGKDLVARTIHNKSRVRRSCFLEINCSALPESLIEAELFGYEKGAFTGAVSSKRGLFELAQGGTLFLNEIGEMPIGLQSKLLSVLEGKRIKRLGGELMTSVHFRVIAATSVDLENSFGKFIRPDLYYRLSVIRMHLPPLRERRMDIPALAAYLLKGIARGSEVVLPESEILKLLEYKWPGNVRELKNVLERAFILKKTPHLYPSEFIATGVKLAMEPKEAELKEAAFETLLQVEQNHLQTALQRSQFNLAQTARALGISLSTLKRKAKKYGLIGKLFDMSNSSHANKLNLLLPLLYSAITQMIE